MIRWNAMAMVVRANPQARRLGGYIASFASSATFDVGFKPLLARARKSSG